MNLQEHHSSACGATFIPLTSQCQENLVCCIISVMFKGNVIPENVSFCDGGNDTDCGEMISGKCKISGDVENLSECKRFTLWFLENLLVKQALDLPDPVAYLLPDSSIFKKKKKKL